MATLNNTHVDPEQDNSIGRRNSTDGTAASDGSSRSSDANGRSWNSSFDSTAGGSDLHGASSLSTSEIVGVSEKRKESSVSQCSVELMDLKDGILETKLHLSKYERDCRICHMTLDSSNQESGVSIELGCSCKDDLAAAHKHCAETWFKIKGNKTCEICNSIACNVVGSNDIESAHQTSETVASATSAPVSSTTETRTCLNGHHLLNFLLACMVFAFLVSWLFHFNIPS